MLVALPPCLLPGPAPWHLAPSSPQEFAVPPLSVWAVSTQGSSSGKWQVPSVGLCAWERAAVLPTSCAPWQLTLRYCAWRCLGGSEPVFSGGLSSPAAAVQGPPPGVLREPACSRASAVWGWAGAWFIVRSLPPVALVLGGGGLGTSQVVLLLVLLPAWLRRVRVWGPSAWAISLAWAGPSPDCSGLESCTSSRASVGPDWASGHCGPGAGPSSPHLQAVCCPPLERCTF